MRSVYTVGDLPALPPQVKLGVVGCPIAHSLSPPMQQAALDAAGLPVRYVRLLCEREGQAFAGMVAALRAAGFAGANVTVPFKKQAYALADEADALSRLCGASNTLVFSESGIRAFNTDGPGFERAVYELCGRRLHEMRVLLLGACGGAGVALAAQCALAGCPDLTLANRPRPELAELAATLGQSAPGCVRAVPMGTPELAAAAARADLVVNATSLGLAEGDALPLDPALLHAGQVVYDLITHASTPLVRAAQACGCTAAGGQSMLLWQGALAFEHWFGRLPDIAAMRRALEAAAR